MYLRLRECEANAGQTGSVQVGFTHTFTSALVDVSIMEVEHGGYRLDQAHEHLSIGGYESNQRPYRIGKGE